MGYTPSVNLSTSQRSLQGGPVTQTSPKGALLVVLQLWLQNLGPLLGTKKLKLPIPHFRPPGLELHGMNPLSSAVIVDQVPSPRHLHEEGFPLDDLSLAVADLIDEVNVAVFVDVYVPVNQIRNRNGDRTASGALRDQLDADIVAVSPSSVWRVLGQAGMLSKWKGKASKKGTGFEQPPQPHQHWHIDVSYINISGTFYYLCSVLDGYSRFIVHWDLRESMTEADIEIILQAAKEKYPEAKPRIISDNGPQFIARDFKEFIRISGMTHVRTSPYYPQSNGKLERWHKSLKSECIRPGTPLTPEDARRLIQQYVDRYNTVRLHSAIGFIAPADMLAGRQAEIHAARDRKLEEARQQRQKRRQKAA
jgi:putative transposase